MKRLLVSLLALAWGVIALAPAASAAGTTPVTYTGKANFICAAASAAPVTSFSQFSCGGINFYDANNVSAGTYSFSYTTRFALYTVNGEVAQPPVQGSNAITALTGFTTPSATSPGTFAFTWTLTDANNAVHTGSVSGTWVNYHICGGRGCAWWAPELVTNAITINPVGFVPAPHVTIVSPSSGPQGSTVTISGSGFTSASAVKFGQTAAASYTVKSDTSITAVTPAVSSGTVDVTVTTAGGTSATTSSDQFTFVPIPRVASLSPTQGTADGGTQVTITGVNFTGATAVSFGGRTASFRVVSDTSIVATAPPGPDSGVTVDVTVTAAAGTSAATSSDRYTYTD
jgi:hypothetical protein